MRQFEFLKLIEGKAPAPVGVLVFGIQFDSATLAPNQITAIKPTYVQVHAQWRNEELKERETVRLAELLHKRGWNEHKILEIRNQSLQVMKRFGKKFAAWC